MKRIRNLTRTGAIALVVLLAARLSYADTLTIPSTAPFDFTLYGELTSVSVTFDPPPIETAAHPGYVYTYDVAPFASGLAPGTRVDFDPFNLLDVGNHSHNVGGIDFDWNGLNINASSALSSNDGEHTPVIDFPEMVVAEDGTLDLPPTDTLVAGIHPHIVDLPAFTRTFAGNERFIWYHDPVEVLVNLPDRNTSLGGGSNAILLGGSKAALIDDAPGALNLIVQNGFLGSTNLAHQHMMQWEPFEPVQTTFEFFGPPIPEPSSIALFGIGLVALAGYGIRRRRA